MLADVGHDIAGEVLLPLVLLKLQGFGFRVSGFGFRVSGFGFRV